MTTENHEIPPPEVQDFANQTNCRVTSLEEMLIAKRAAITEYSIESLETDDGPLYRVVAPNEKTVSPLFFSRNCLEVYLTRMPLLTFEEWDSFQLQMKPEEIPAQKENETNS